MFPTLQIGPLALPVPALIILIGIWLGLTLSEKHASRYGVRADLLFNLVLIAFIAGLVGARLTYILRYPTAFIESPLDIFSRNPGLLDPVGGTATGIISGAIYGQRKGMELLPTLDALTPFLGVVAVAVNLSNLASGNAFGAPTDLPWGIDLWGARRHPTQIYETFTTLIILALIWPGRGIIKSKVQGLTFLSFLGMTALARLILESTHGDSSLFVNGIRSAQIMAWLILGASLLGIWRLQYSGSDKSTSSGDHYQKSSDPEEKINK
ncbi:MAG: prolipoprotein diacylglyceryl transferase [Anaerolineales bacterium]|jgi:prolipoprotein diacylglyceryltransferase